MSNMNQTPQNHDGLPGYNIQQLPSGLYVAEDAANSRKKAHPRGGVDYFGEEFAPHPVEKSHGLIAEPHQVGDREITLMREFPADEPIPRTEPPKNSNVTEPPVAPEEPVSRLDGLTVTLGDDTDSEEQPEPSNPETPQSPNKPVSIEGKLGVELSELQLSRLLDSQEQGYTEVYLQDEKGRRYLLLNPSLMPELPDSYDPQQWFLFDQHATLKDGEERVFVLSPQTMSKGVIRLGQELEELSSGAPLTYNLTNITALDARSNISADGPENSTAAHDFWDPIISIAADQPTEDHTQGTTPDTDPLGINDDHLPFDPSRAPEHHGRVNITGLPGDDSQEPSHANAHDQPTPERLRERAELFEQFGIREYTLQNGEHRYSIAHYDRNFSKDDHSRFDDEFLDAELRDGEPYFLVRFTQNGRPTEEWWSGSRLLKEYVHSDRRFYSLRRPNRSGRTNPDGTRATREQRERNTYEDTQDSEAVDRRNALRRQLSVVTDTEGKVPGLHLPRLRNGNEGDRRRTARAMGHLNLFQENIGSRVRDMRRQRRQPAQAVRRQVSPVRPAQSVGGPAESVIRDRSIPEVQARTPREDAELLEDSRIVSGLAMRFANQERGLNLSAQQATALAVSTPQQYWTDIIRADGELSNLPQEVRDYWDSIIAEMSNN